MTVPSYTTDLNDIATADESSGWAESTVWNDGNISMQETDYYIQGSYCVSSELKIAKSGYASIIYNYGSNLYSSFGTDYVVTAWFKFLGPNVLDTDANGGIYITVGSGLDDFMAYDQGGSEFYRYGGWINMAADPKYDLRGQDVAVGTPSSGSSFQYFGIGIKEINPISKGNPLGVDAIRYGRCQAIFEHGETADYCTFAGFAAINDANDATDGYNRWGLIQEIAGGYLWKGLMSCGTASNLCDFRDSNVNITLDNTKKVSPTFNKIEVRNTSSNIDWTGINFISLSTVSPGIFHVVDDATVALDGCSFTDMSFFIFKSNSTIDDTTFRRCSYVNQNGATFDGCTFTNMTSAVGLLADDIDEISNCSFVSDGTGHAIELETDHAGNTYTFDGNSFTGYASTDGSTGNESIYNNSGGAVTINVQNGLKPTIRNGSGASTTVSLSVTLTLSGILSGSGPGSSSYVVILEQGTTTPLASGAVGATGEFEYTYEYSAGTYVDIQVVSVDYDNLRIEDYLLQSTNATLPIQQVSDRWYSNVVTGVVTRTFGERPEDDYDSVTSDTYIENTNTTYNYGASDELTASILANSSLFKRALVKMDVSRLDSAITLSSAKLYLYLSSSNAFTVNCRRLVRDWGEGDNDGVAADTDECNWTYAKSTSVSWGTAGCGSSTTDYTTTNGASLSSPAAGWVSFDVTNIVQGWIDGSYSNYGFRISSDGVSNPAIDYAMTFYSSEYTGDTSLRPYLEVTYDTGY